MLKNGCDYIMFLDSDMVAQHDLITRLISHNKDIVSGVAFKRSAPFTPCFYKDCRIENGNPVVRYVEKWNEGELLEVQGVGTACMLIKREVFEKMRRPWFYPHMSMGEDLPFCIHAREMGYKIFVDTSLCVGHLTTSEVREDYWYGCRDNVVQE